MTETSALLSLKSSVPQKFSVIKQNNDEMSITKLSNPILSNLF